MKISNFKTLIVIVLLQGLISCSTFISKIDSGSLKGIAFYDPVLKQTLYFKEKLVKHKTWDGYPKSDYSSITSEEELDYTFDVNTHSGTIGGKPFTVGFTKTNKTLVYLIYDDMNYVLEEGWSDDPNKGSAIFFITLIIVASIYLMYRFRPIIKK
jgi:hypothetical protein